MTDAEEGDKLIAELMGGKWNDTYNPEYPFYDFEHGSFSIDELKYQTSWEWLMPVVEKIRNFRDGEYDTEGHTFGGLSVHISSAYPIGWNCHILGTLNVLHITPQKTHTYSDLKYSKSLTDIDLKKVVRLSVVEFIKWYKQTTNISK